MDKIVLCLRSSLCADGIATTHTAHHAPQQHRQSNKRSWKFRLKPWFCQQTLKKHFGIYSCAVVPDNMAVFYVTVLKGPGCWQCGHYTRSGSLSEAGFWQLHMRSWQVHLTTWFCFLHYSTNVSLGAGSVATTLTVDHALKQHSGNYTCAVGSLASATVAVHILNGKTG